MGGGEAHGAGKEPPLYPSRRESRFMISSAEVKRGLVRSLLLEGTYSAPIIWSFP